MGYLGPNQVLNLPTIRLFKRLEVANIKWLKDVRQMCQREECNSLMILIEDLEVGGVVALVPIEDHYAIYRRRTRLRMLFEALNPF